MWHFVVFLISFGLATANNDGCGSVVSKCCKCKLNACKDCLNCLDELYMECCGCLDKDDESSLTLRLEIGDVDVYPNRLTRVTNSGPPFVF